jgi:anti-sigma regulatory factor (Ser/Thr protein kinase)
VSLLVSELVTNSIRHAETTTPASIELQARVLADRVRVEVRDRGPGFEPKPQPPHRRSRSGWGLYLVDQVADRWGVTRDDGTGAWFEIDRD